MTYNFHIFSNIFESIIPRDVKGYIREVINKLSALNKTQPSQYVHFKIQQMNLTKIVKFNLKIQISFIF